MTGFLIEKIRITCLFGYKWLAITVIGKSLPYDIIYTYNVLLIAILVVDDHSGANLDPSVASSLVEEAEVRTHDLAFLDYCGHMIKWKF